MIAGVVVEQWKQAVFERHLREAGYTFTSHAAPVPNCNTLKVQATDIEALGQVVKAAQAECHKQGAPA
ncbi:MAG: hypothetical protein EOP39_24595 [Rubrivivax sp.]|nr:MAG: hypothetical protein EOP39_24595 [Rubrivivax sp.]